MLIRRVALLLPLYAAAAFGQSHGVISGTVTNAENGKPVPDVLVTATSPNLQGEVLVQTDASGGYRIPQLPLDVYTLHFEAEGFKPFKRGDITLGRNRTIRVNIQLLPTSFEASDEVIGRAPNIDIGSTGSGVSVDKEFMQRIAVVRPGGKNSESRSFESLAELAPGAQGDGYGVSRSPGASPEKPFIIDGVAANSQSPSVAGANSTATAPSTPPMPSWATGRYPPMVLPTGEPVTVHRAPSPPERTQLPPGLPFDEMYFRGFGVNPTIDTEEERYSTFSVDTDSASYSLARNFLQRGSLPAEDAVRVEEFVNSFDYGYTSDDGHEPFSIYAEAFPSPSRKGYHVVHLGLKAREVSEAARKPSHLVFTVDVSGSMNIENRLGLVKQALRLLVEKLDERDFISIVVYGSTAHVVLEPTNATQKARILAGIEALRPEGATNVQAGLQLAYGLAERHFRPGTINRVILCSDGVANNGVTEADGIWAKVKGLADRGITLTTVGFGMGNYNDVLMERLAQIGEGQYAYVDRLEEAQRIFAQNLTSTLQVVAKDVKLQVEFNPAAVSRYRLVGYENRLLAKEQFADDRVDAGEVGAGHSVTAIYEVRLHDPQQPLATFRIRHKDPEGGASRLIEKRLPASIVRATFGEASATARLSVVAAAFAEKLRGSYWVRPLSWKQLQGLWSGLSPKLRERADVAELGRLIGVAGRLDGRPDRFESIAPVSTMDFDRPPRLK
jgi:Ca-activated chloride channel family protein